MRQRILSVLIVLVGSAACMSGVPRKAEDVQHNSRFSVVLRPNGVFEIEDRKYSSKWSVLAGSIGEWLLHPSGRWIAYEVISSELKSNCLLDLGTRFRSCGAALEREPGEGPWSPSGDLLVWKSPDGTQLHLGESNSVTLASEQSLPVSSRAIQGEPLGLIWQQKWLSDSQLLVGTGSGESACFGVVDYKANAFFYLDCCRTPDCSIEELRMASQDPEAWLNRRGLLEGQRLWKLADSMKYPWEGVSRNHKGREGSPK